MGRRLWRSVESVRVRAAIAAGLVVGMALLGGGLLLLALLRHSLLHDVDEASRARALDVAALAQQGSLPARLALPDLKDDDDGLVQVIDSAGVVRAATANLDGHRPIARLHPRTGGALVRTVHGIQNHGDDFRLAAFGVTSPHGPLTVYVATNLDFIGHSTRAVRRMLFFGVPGLLGLVAMTTWLLVGRALRPVESIRSQVASISGRALHRRVPVPQVDDEIGNLARTMNAMLDRLEEANERQSRFVSDASHELRSPLAIARTQIEVALAHPEVADWPITGEQLLVQNQRMERLVLDLLYLARSDAGQRSLRKGPVDLEDLVLEEVATLRVTSHAAVEATEVDAARVTGDADALRRVIRNLLNNAERHARTRIVVEVRAETGETILAVEDDGPGIALEDRERVFDRFTRLDDSRSRDGGGVGLGLSIVREIVRAHGGSVVVEESAIGARFVVRVPRPAVPAAPEHRFPWLEPGNQLSVR